VVRIAVADPYNLGQEFFRWEIATAVAGSLLGINAFNQLDIDTSKVAARKLVSEYKRMGSLSRETQLCEQSGIKLFTDKKNAAKLALATGRGTSLVGYLSAHLNRLPAGDYFALLSYVDVNEARGGPNMGVFPQVSCDDAVDLPVTAKTYIFRIVKVALALA